MLYMCNVKPLLATSSELQTITFDYNVRLGFNFVINLSKCLAESVK